MATSRLAQDEQYKWRNFWICFLVSLEQIAFGYPASIIGVTLGQPSVMTYMGLVDSETGEPTPGSNKTIDSFSGVFQAGAVVGALIDSWIMDRFGRKAGVAYCSFFSLFGGAWLTGSTGTAMSTAARFFAGMGSWGFLAVTPTYCAELAPPKLRGFFVGMNGVSIALGYGLALYMGMAFFYAPTGETQWRAPLGIALLWPVMMLAVIFLPIVPESPRWLTMRNRVDDAREATIDLHSHKRDPEQHFARSEFYQMHKQAKFDRTLRRAGPSYRKRTVYAGGFAFVGHSTAILVINNYGPILYGQLGFNVENNLSLQCGCISVGVVFNLIGALLMDRFGRKLLMVFECENKTGLAFGVVAFYVLLAVYSLGVDVCGVLWYSEVFPNHILAKGICFSTAVIAMTSLVYLQVTSIALATIGWKYWLVFICITAVGGTLFAFILPETKGIPLEEIARIFGETEDVRVFSRDIPLDGKDDVGSRIEQGEHREEIKV